MRIAINLTYLKPGKVGGSEIYALAITAGLRALGHEPVLYGPASVVESFGAHCGEPLETIIVRDSRLQVIGRLHENFGLARVCRQRGVQAVWSPGNFGAPMLRMARDVTQVVTIHDMLHSDMPTALTWKRRTMRRAMMWLTVQGADGIATVSDFSRKRILVKYRRARRIGVTVAAPGAHIAEDRVDPSSEAQHLPSRFIAYAAQRMPHKNHLLLVDVFETIAESDDDLHLVMCGPNGPASAPLRDRISASPYAGRVVDLRDTVPCRADVLDLVGRASLVVFPSAYEGFGLAVVEAMALGTPVVASDIEGLAECTGGTTFQVSADASTEEWADAVRQCLALDPASRAAVCLAARTHACRFNPTTAADALLDAIARGMSREARPSAG